MIAIIRIKGQVGMDKDIIETFYRLRLRRKYACIVIDKPTPEQLGMLKKVENFVAFGKQGVTSRGTKRDIRQRINLDTIELNLDKYGKKTAKGYEVKLEKYKILGNGKVKNKLFITCLEASESAIEKVTTAGGEIILKEIKPINTPLVEHPKKKKA